MLVTSRSRPHEIWNFRFTIYVRFHFYRHRYIASFICSWNIRRSVIVRCNPFNWYFLIDINTLFHFRIRGKLGSMALLIRSNGYLVAFVVGAYVEYSIVPFIYLGIPILFFAILIYLPNTAPYLIRSGKHEVSFNSKRIKYRTTNQLICNLILSIGSETINKVLQRIHWHNGWRIRCHYHGIRTIGEHCESTNENNGINDFQEIP